MFDEVDRGSNRISLIRPRELQMSVLVNEHRRCVTRVERYSKFNMYCILSLTQSHVWDG